MIAEAWRNDSSWSDYFELDVAIPRERPLRLSEIITNINQRFDNSIDRYLIIGAHYKVARLAMSNTFANQ